MAYDAQVQESVRRRYVHERQNLKAAAALAGVPYATARTWKKKALSAGDNWDVARQMDLVADGGVTELRRMVLTELVPMFESSIQALNDPKSELTALQRTEILSRLADAYAKCVRAAGAVDPDFAKLSIALDTIKEETQYAREHHPECLEALLKVLNGFGPYITQKYGKK